MFGSHRAEPAVGVSRMVQHHNPDAGVARISFMSCVQSVNFASGTGLAGVMGKALKWPVAVVTSLPVTAVK